MLLGARRQRNIGFERVYPLHARVDTERISAKFKNGALEIRLPDKAHSLRAFYAAQVRLGCRLFVCHSSFAPCVEKVDD